LNDQNQRIGQSYPNLRCDFVEKRHFAVEQLAPRLGRWRLEYGRHVVDGREHEFDRRVWDRATHDEAFLAAGSRALLYCVLDDQGRESAWTEIAPTVEQPGDSFGEHGGSPLNVRKRVSKRIADSDAVAAAVASWATYRSTLLGRIDWVVVMAVDDAGHTGYVARVEQEADGLRWIVGSPVDWPLRTRAAFNEPDIEQVLDPVREALLHMVSQGLRDAARRRRGRTRRVRRQVT
jgi:hypothetical protein